MDDIKTEPVDFKVTQLQDYLTEQTQHVNMITGSVCGEKGMEESFKPDTIKSEQFCLGPSSFEESLSGEGGEGSKARVKKRAKIRKDEDWERMLDGKYKCTYCNYTNKKARLKEHARIHTGEKPHRCLLCSFTSAYQRNISRHHRRCHKLPPKTGGERSLPSKRKVKLIVKLTPPKKKRVPKSDDLIDPSSDLHHPLNNDEDMAQKSLDSSLSTNTNGVSSHDPPAQMSTITFPGGVSEDEMPPIVTQHQDLGSPCAVGVQASPPAEDSCYPEDKKYSPSRASHVSYSQPGTPGQDQPHKCLHCDVDFNDNILYTIHMGCHGYEHPFQCNICGCTCKDKYDFACHFALGRHAK